MIDFTDLIKDCIHVDGGREFPYYDCYGLVLEVRKRLGLPQLPEYSEIRIGEGMQSAFKEGVNHAVRCEPKPGAVAICWKGGLVRHVAVIIELDKELRALETNPKKNATHSCLKVFERRFSKVEYYI